MTTTTFGKLGRGDVIVCPGDGRPDKVTETWKVGKGHVCVRTRRHDHTRGVAEPVEKVDQ